jgi:hypothetical protein
VELNSGSRLPNLFEGAGLQDVRIRRYKYPGYLWDDMTDAEKRLAEHNKDFVSKMVSMMLKKLGAVSRFVDKEKVNRTIQSVNQEAENWGRGSVVLCYVWTLCFAISPVNRSTYHFGGFGSIKIGLKPLYSHDLMQTIVTFSHNRSLALRKYCSLSRYIRQPPYYLLVAIYEPV